MNYPHVFSPLKLAGVEVPNRFCLTATLTNLGSRSLINDAWVNFHAQRAVGGTGLIVTEAVAVDSDAVAHPAVIATFDDDNLTGFSELASQVHATGSIVVAQLWHAGRQQLWRPTRTPQGVSDQPDAYSWTVPHVMNDAEIHRVIESFVVAAVRLQQCGLDGVELHGAHGYLITQFLSPWSNVRDDQWGSSLEGRSRFCLRIAEQIRQRCGEDFIIGIKMPADEGVDGGIDVDEAALITAHLRRAELFDYFAYSQGNFSLSLENHVPDMHFRSGHFLDLHRQLHEAADGVPIMAIGRIDSAELADRVVGEGYGELVGMSRSLTADTNFVRKARDGKAGHIRPSLYDNFGWGIIHTGRPIVEAQNPQLALPDEASWTPGSSANPGRIAVVGSGPGGLEFAWLAAARGHAVTLFGKSDSAGGKLRQEATLPGHEGVQRYVDYQIDQCDRSGVKRIADTVVDGRLLEQLNRDEGLDHIVLAMGSDMRWPDDLETEASENESIQSLSLYQFTQRLASGLDAADAVSPFTRARTAVVFDQDHTAPVYAVAQSLAETFERVVLVTPRPDIAQAVNYCSKLGIHRRLHDVEIQIVPSTTLVRLDTTDVICRNVFSGRLEIFDQCDLLVYATPRRVNRLDLGPSVDGIGVPIVHSIGDCKSPRNLMMAIHEAHALASSL